MSSSLSLSWLFGVIPRLTLMRLLWNVINSRTRNNIRSRNRNKLNMDYTGGQSLYAAQEGVTHVCSYHCNASPLIFSETSNIATNEQWKFGNTNKCPWWFKCNIYSITSLNISKHGPRVTMHWPRGHPSHLMWNYLTYFSHCFVELSMF